jgi:hypothetical protein
MGWLSHVLAVVLVVLAVVFSVFWVLEALDIFGFWPDA